MNAEMQNIVKQLLGKSCERTKVGDARSLSIGFGDKIQNIKHIRDGICYREWEIGTYYCDWRIIKDGRIVCGSNDPADSIDELDRSVNNIKIGKICSISSDNDLDIRVAFDNGIIIDFLATIRDEDEYFHIFCPDNTYAEFGPGAKWKIGRSNVPWNAKMDS